MRKMTYKMKHWFPTFYCNYLWWKFQDIWRNIFINSLLCTFECPYLWRNYRTKSRTRIINTLLWSKLFWNKYVQKNTFWTEEHTLGNRSSNFSSKFSKSFPLTYRTYHRLESIRTNRNQSEHIFDSNQNPFSHVHTNFRFESNSLNLSEPDRTFPPRRPLSLPALPSVLQCISHFGVASPLRVGGANTKVFLRRAPCSIQAPPWTGDRLAS